VTSQRAILSTARCDYTKVARIAKKVAGSPTLLGVLTQKAKAILASSE
jgi:hypothetical protein